VGRWRDFWFGKPARFEATRTYIGFPTADAGLVGGGVTSTTALGLSSVWRCIDILSNGVSQLDWREMRGNLELPPSRLARRPYPDLTRREWVSLMVSTAALYDVAYALKVGGVDSEGVPVALLPLNPGIVQPIATDSLSILPPSEFWVGTEKVSREDLVIMHRSPLPGITDDAGGVIRLARITLAAAIAAEGYASRYWQAGGSPTTIIETPNALQPAQAEALSSAWTSMRQLGPDYAAVLGGASAKSFGADPTQQAAVEARREQVADVGRYFGVPTRILNAPTGDSETYSSAESANHDLVRYTLQNYIGMIEDALSDLLPGGRHITMDIRRLTAGTQIAQAQALQLMTGGKPVMSVDEARETLGLPPIEEPSQLEPIASPAQQQPQPSE
jgi:HK97 family phage portal protein